MFKGKNCNNLSSLTKKQPSLRRLNQLIISEQRLAPVLENTTTATATNNTTPKRPGETSLNNQLFLLRKNLSNHSNQLSNIYDYALANKFEKLDKDKTQSNANIAEETTKNESIYNLATSKNSLLNYTTISELEKRASAIITNSAAAVKLAKNSVTNLTNVKPAEASPKSNVSVASDTSLPSASSPNSTNPNQTIMSSGTAHDTDSGRHSMSDSPSLVTSGSQPSANSPYFSSSPANNTNASFMSKQANGLNKTSAGTFTSKCILSSGTAVTMAQTMQKLQQQQQIQQKASVATGKPMDSVLIKKKSRSTSRDVMTKSSSFCKPQPTAGQASTNRSQSIGRVCSSSSINANSNNSKRSTSSINRNCSEL